MFSGIIQNQGTVVARWKRGGILRLRIKLNPRGGNSRARGGDTVPLQAGESIAVDGVCLTVAKESRRGFEADVIGETLRATALGGLRQGDRVNLERSLQAGQRIGGHFVTGHVDGVGRIVRWEKRGRNRALEIQTSKEIIRQLAKKGCVAVDGISLTVQAVKGRSFKTALIPTTLRETTLARKRPGAYVHLEVDLITRYLKVILESSIPQAAPSPKTRTRRSVTLTTLKRQGF